MSLTDRAIYLRLLKSQKPDMKPNYQTWGQWEMTRVPSRTDKLIGRWERIFKIYTGCSTKTAPVREML